MIYQRQGTSATRDAHLLLRTPTAPYQHPMMRPGTWTDALLSGLCCVGFVGGATVFFTIIGG